MPLWTSSGNEQWVYPSLRVVSDENLTAGTVYVVNFAMTNSTATNYDTINTINAFGTGGNWLASHRDQFRQVWLRWNQYSYDSPFYEHISPEEQRRRNEIAARRQIKARREKQLAFKRGRRLLLRHLTPEQQREYATTGRFTVEAADGRAFRLRKGRTAELLGPDGKPVASYCIHPSGFIAEDTLLAQKLLLETDPASFEEIANITVHRQVSRAQEEHWLREHVEEARAMLRAEGIEDPDAWEADLRRQVQRINGVPHIGGAEYRPSRLDRRGLAALAIIEDQLRQNDQVIENLVTGLEEGALAA